MYKSQILKKFLKGKRATLLNIGPMSKNLVDVSIEISDKFNLPLKYRMIVDCNIYLKTEPKNPSNMQTRNMSSRKHENEIFGRFHDSCTNFVHVQAGEKNNKNGYKRL